MAKLDNFETVKLVQALTTINDGGVNQSILLELGSIELIKDTGEGTYSVYYTDDNGDVEYICTAQTHSMAGGLATVLYNVNQELGCLVY
tara:strand:- start:554 stop:820 length:267 start_codon:yes stop_codon:yes gene_type:complete